MDIHYESASNNDSVYTIMNHISNQVHPSKSFYIMFFVWVMLYCEDFFDDESDENKGVDLNNDLIVDEQNNENDDAGDGE